MTPRALACVCAAIALAACPTTRKRRGAEQVPASWSDVRQTVGHQVHVGDHHIACRDCHGDRFAPLPAEVCSACHAGVRSTIHLDFGLATPDPVPSCQDCHGFRDRAVRPTACMRCHDRERGKHAAVGAHSDQPCGDCHRAHVMPSLAPKPCESCHAEQRTAHAGKRGCRDCHTVHEAGTAADAGCASCHAKLQGRAHVELIALPNVVSAHSAHAARPLGDGHRKCTGCHLPHAFGKTEVARCTTCHTEQRVLASAKHGACVACHAPHDAGRPRRCAGCHTQTTSHPAIDVSLDAKSLAKDDRGNFTMKGETGGLEHRASPSASACATCHPPHGRVDVITCVSCHAKQPTHAKAACQNCHKPHAARPALTAALCATCHADQSRRAASSGHANCTRCHLEAAHAPAKPAPACATCHAIEVSSAPPGHQKCADCHDVHASARKPVGCATCHVDKAKVTHGTQDCTTCHRAHGGTTATPSPTCATCHPADKRPGLHASKGHQECSACHNAHERAPRDDRSTCTARCHPAQARHEPTAQRCATCHPFGS